MNPAYIAVLVAVLVSSAPLLSSFTDRQREKALDRYARQVNLALTPQVRPRVVRRIRARERATMIGGAAGAVIGFLVGLGLPSLASGSRDTGWVLTVGIGVGVGSVLATVTTAVISTIQDQPGPRIARPTAPEITDYVPRMELWFAPVALGCAGLALAGGVIALATRVLTSDLLSPADLFRSAGAILAYAAVLACLAGRVLVRRVLDAGQPAASEQELAWDDALRASTLRGLVQLPTALAAGSVLFTFVEVGTRTRDQPMMIGLIGVSALLIFVAAATVALTLDLSTRPRQHYWRELWNGGRQVAAR